MTLRDLVVSYLDAWNRRDVDHICNLLHPGAAYYDAFWTETCVGRNLPEYLRACLGEDEYWYEMVDDLVVVEGGAVYRYAAHCRDGTNLGEIWFSGAEVLTVRDNRILTISNFYCDPDPKVLMEVARLAIARHGQPTFVDAGHAGYKYFHVKKRLLNELASGETSLGPTLTVTDLAGRVGCSVEQLLTIVTAEFGADVEKFRARPAKIRATELLPV